MNKQKFIIKSAAETQKLAHALAKKILKSKSGSVAIGLIGDLGSGKTTFTKGFAKGLGIKRIIQSPTFIILKKFQIPNSKFQTLSHIDAYRIRPKDLIMLGWKDLIADPVNIIIVEWADRVKKILPKRHLKIFFKHLKNGKREISIR